VDQIWVPRYAKWGVPLQHFLDSSEIKNILPQAIETCIYKDSLVAVPLYIDIGLMFYRDDILRKQPDYAELVEKLENSITWEDFIELGNRFKSGTNPFYIFQADDYEGLICSFAELMANQNNPMISKDDKVLIDSPEGKKSLQLLVDLVNKYNISPQKVSMLRENESFRFFAENDGLFVRGWPSMIDDENEFLSDDERSNIKIVPLPHLKDSEPKLIFGGWNLMVSKFSDKQPEVIQFAKFLLSEESQKIMYEEGRYLPINTRIYADKNFINKYPDLIKFNNLYRYGVHRPFLEDYTNVSDILSYYLNLAIRKEISVDEALKDATKKINEKVILVK